MPRIGLMAALAALFWTGAAVGDDEVPRSRYIRYIPLAYPSVVRATEATTAFALYGDARSVDFVDVSPKDGIDDRRARWLKTLGARFSPFMVQNSVLFPMNWKRFIGMRSSFPLFVDEWELARSPAELRRSYSIDFEALGGAPCAIGPTGVALGTTPTPATDSAVNDCLLRDLIHTFDPANPDNAWARRASASPSHVPFEVLYFDFPGTGPESWKAEYQRPHAKLIRDRYDGFRMIYLHPFIASARSPQRFEFVLQYWFFYPTNDSDNKHEGDWEHINVIVSPLRSVGKGLSPVEMNALLSRPIDGFDGNDPIVIERIDYYFHHNVFTLDFAFPNVYKPLPAWEAEVDAARGQRIGSAAMAEAIRERAYADRDEKFINTHPIAFIGGSSKGPEILISAPGSRNQDSHGTYPFPGLFKEVGALGASEEIRRDFDLRDYVGPGCKPWPSEVMRFDDPALIDLLPDWENIAPLARTDADVRRELGWMLLPILWGYPATQSKGAGIIPHADTGNVPPVTPTYSPGWNRTGATTGFASYDPNRLPSIIPLSPLDTISNQLGYLNLPLLALTTLPPLDFVYRVVLLPVRAVVPPPMRPIYVPGRVRTTRAIGIGLGASAQIISDDFNALFLSAPQGQALADRLQLGGGDLNAVSVFSTTASDPTSLLFYVGFFMGRHFTTENTFRHSNSDLGLDVQIPGQLGRRAIRGELSMYEYAGSLRYDVLTGGFKPFAALGYGLSWYRLQNIRVDGIPLGVQGAWIRQPSIFPFHNLLPNTWHWTLGIEYVFLRSSTPLSPSLSIRGDYTMFIHSLGLDIRGFVLDATDADPEIHRSSFNVLAVLSL